MKRGKFLVMFIVGLVLSTGIGSYVLAEGCDSNEVDLNGVCGTIDEGIGPNYIDMYGEIFDMGSLTITRGDESIKILDRNLGATDRSSGSDGYGYKFQWGNNFGFSAYGAYYTHLGSSVDTLGLGYSWENPYMSYFFGDFTEDWSNPSNGTLWGDSGIGEFSMQGPCPEGTHIPTKEELEKLSSWMSGSANDMSNLLYMPFAGYRDGAESIPGLGSVGYYRSTSRSSDNSYSLVAPQNGSISITPNERAKASSIRCFFDTEEYVVLSYDTMGGSSMQGQTVKLGEKAHVPGYSPQKDNSVLEGWYKNPSYSEEFLFSGESEGLENNTTIYAKWRCADGYTLINGECEKTYKVVFNSMGGSKVDTQMVISGNAIDYIIPERRGAEFIGWYYTQYYAIDVNDPRFPQGCNTEGLPHPDEYCILVSPAKSRSFSGYFYIAPFSTEVVKNAKMADYYCKNNILIGDIQWDLPIERGYMLGTEWAYFWTLMRNNRSKLFNFNAQGSGKPNHYWAGYSNPTESQNCILSANCGRENSNTKISSRCISSSETPIDLPNAPSEQIGEYLDGDIVSGNIILEAAWRCKEGYIMENGICRGYEILFDANGGTFSGGYNQNIVEYVVNDEGKYEPTQEVEIPNKGSNVFLGWYRDSSLTNLFEEWSDGVELSGDIVLYAKYGSSEDICNVTYIDENGVILRTGMVLSGGYLSSYNIPEKTGYQAIGWFESGSDSDLEWQFSTRTVTGDVILYPKYQVRNYDISYFDENGVQLSSGQSAYGSHLGGYPIPTKTGYQAIGWYYLSGGTYIEWNFSINVVEGDVSLYPQYIQVNNGGSNNGGSSGRGRLSEKDECSDGLCNQESHTVASEENEESSNMPSNVPSGGDSKLKRAYNYAKDNGIISSNSIEEANLSGNLTRIEMSEIVSKFAINILGMSPDSDRVNKFRDVDDKLDSQYSSGVELSYGLGVMGINMPNNEFRPFDLVPKAESTTVLSRLFYRTSDGEYENSSLYYTHHVDKLQKEGVITNVDPYTLERRGNLILILMDSIIRK